MTVHRPQIAAVMLATALAATACSSGAVAPRPPAPQDLGLPIDATEESADPPSPAFAIPDITARPIELDDLAAMLPDDPEHPDGARPDAVTTRSNEWLITSAVLDREDEAGDVDDYGRLAGVGTRYRGEASDTHVWIDVLSGAAAGHGYLLDVAGDAVKGVGGTHAPGQRVIEAVEFPVAAGEEAIGLVATLEGGTTETIVLFRIGRIVVFASVERDDTSDARVATQYLADDIADRVIAVLLGVDPGRPPVPGPRSFRFAYELSVAGPTGAVRTVTADGTVTEGDIACRVRTSGGDLPVDRDLVVVDDYLWARDHGAGDFHGVGAGTAPDRSLLAWCPPWPVEADRAGLADLLTSTPASADLETGPALGYRIDRDGLATLLDTDLDEAELEVFNVWVSAGTPWIVDLGLTVTAEAGLLHPLTGTGFAPDTVVRVTLRQQLFDLESVADPVLRPGL